jgi:hypothetical protein
VALIPRRTAVIATFAAALLAAVIAPAGSAFAGSVAPPVLTGPANNTTTPLKAVVLTWNAVAGASQYQVQISPNDEWTNNTVTLPNSGETVNDLYEVPLSLPHGSYFWRVRAEVGGVWSSYSASDQFLRDWDDPLTILRAPTSSDPTIVWAPVKDASEYLVRFSESPNYPTGPTTFNCVTNQTSFTPYALASSKEVATGSCFDESMLTTGTAYYWEVQPLDDTTAAALVTDATNDPDWECAQTTPECDAGAFHSSSTFTFTAPAANDPAPGTITGLTTSWHTTSTTGTGCDVATPCPVTPTFSWTSVTGANYYEVHVYRDPELTNTYRVYDTAWPELTPRDSFFDAQAGHSYYWTVQGGTCTNSDTDPTCSLGSGSGSSAASCPAGTGPDNPTLSTSTDDISATPAGNEGSDSVTGGVTSTVTLTNGSNLAANVCIAPSIGSVTNIRQLSSTSVSFTYHPPIAGGTATFTATNLDGSTPSAASGTLTVDPSTRVHFDDFSDASTFNKSSGPVALTAPAAGSTVHGRSVTFSWADYQTSGSQGTYDARNYDLQVSKDPDFDTTVIDDPDVDLTQYTDPTTVLANGTYYWRVAAIDESGNTLTWSTTRQVTVNATPPSIGLTTKNGVSIKGPLTIALSESVSGVSSSTVKVVPAGSTTAVPGKLKESSSDLRYEFAPSSPLITGETYSLTVSPSLADQYGNGAVVTSKTVTTSTTAKNNSSAWSLGAAWKRHSASGARSGSYESATAGHTADIKVVGSSATLYACKGPNMGTITVTAGGHKSKVSEHQSFTRCGVAVWTGSLKSGVQKISVAVTKGPSGNVDELTVK